jgi:hypothetical protein
MSKGWIEVVILDQATGEPVPQIALKVTLPDGSIENHRTDAAGRIFRDKIDSGICEISCELDLDKMNLKNTYPLDHVERQISAAVDSSLPKPAPGPNWIAKILPHHVATGERLDTLGKKTGMDWKQLAKFNWGTDLPKKIHWYLRDSVGCTHKTKDGKNYLSPRTIDSARRSASSLLPMADMWGSLWETISVLNLPPGNGNKK